MKRIVCFALCCLTGTLLFSCTKKPTQTPAQSDAPRITVTVVNAVNEADVWILPDTEANRKTTLWGTATVAKLNVNDKQPASLEESESGAYLFRMIDSDHMYYQADGVVLQEGFTLRLYGTDVPMEFLLEVCDASGAIAETYAVFAASL